MNYIDYINKDNLTSLDYIDYDIYLDHKEDFKDCSNLSTLITNGIIVDSVNQIDNDLFLLISAIFMIIYEHNDLTHDELLKYQYRIKELYNTLESEYNNSKNKLNIWNHIPISIYDIFNRIKNESSFMVKDLNLDVIFSKDYYRYIFSFKEGKK